MKLETIKRNAFFDELTKIAETQVITDRNSHVIQTLQSYFPDKKFPEPIESTGV